MSSIPVQFCGTLQSLKDHTDRAVKNSDRLPGRIARVRQSSSDTGQLRATVVTSQTGHLTGQRNVKYYLSAAFWILHLRAVPSMLGLSAALANGIKSFNAPAADSLTPEQLKRASHEVTQLAGRLRKFLRMYRDSGIRELPPYRSILDRIEDRTEHLASIAEGMQLSLNEDVADALLDASEGLRSASEDLTGRRVLVGPM